MWQNCSVENDSRETVRQEMEKPRIFISYSSKDWQTAEIIHEKLGSAGLDVWRDKKPKVEVEKEFGFMKNKIPAGTTTFIAKTEKIKDGKLDRTNIEIKEKKKYDLSMKVYVDNSKSVVLSDQVAKNLFVKTN